ncbi:hypothetical protein, partial [Rothia sp. 88186D007BW]
FHWPVFRIGHSHVCVLPVWATHLVYNAFFIIATLQSMTMATSSFLYFEALASNPKTSSIDYPWESLSTQLVVHYSIIYRSRPVPRASATRYTLRRFFQARNPSWANSTAKTPSNLPT